MVHRFIFLPPNTIRVSPCWRLSFTSLPVDVAGFRPGRNTNAMRARYRREWPVSVFRVVVLSSSWCSSGCCIITFFQKLRVRPLSSRHGRAAWGGAWSVGSWWPCSLDLAWESHEYLISKWQVSRETNGAWWMKAKLNFLKFTFFGGRRGRIKKKKKKHSG